LSISLVIFDPMMIMITLKTIAPPIMAVCWNSPS